jgi:hypothetical protein
MTTQSESELRTFREFVKAAGLPIVPHSVEKRPPPEPDVFCQLLDGSAVAFELMEICNPGNARYMNSATEKYDLIVSAYHNLPPQVRDAFDVRFVDVPLSFCFRRDASIAYIRNALPYLLTELASVSIRQDQYADFSPKVAAAVDSVNERGRHNAAGEVNFNIGGEYDHAIPLDALTAKLRKVYEASCPIELVAHFGPLAWGADRSYCDTFVRLLEEEGLGPFRRVWVQDWQGIGLVVPPIV